MNITELNLVYIHIPELTIFKHKEVCDCISVNVPNVAYFTSIIKLGNRNIIGMIVVLLSLIQLIKITIISQ